MIILELCCGWKSVSRVFAEDGGWSVTTLDILPKFRPDILADITEWDYESYFENHPIPDVIWASPPCRTFTVQAWGKYRDSNGGGFEYRRPEGGRVRPHVPRVHLVLFAQKSKIIIFC